MAYEPGKLVSGLSLHPPGGKPGIFSEIYQKYLPRMACHRDLARCSLEFCVLGAFFCSFFYFGKTMAGKEIRKQQDFIQMLSFVCNYCKLPDFPGGTYGGGIVLDRNDVWAGSSLFNPGSPVFSERLRGNSDFGCFWLYTWGKTSVC